MVSTKEEIRRRLRACRDGLSPEDRAARSARIARRCADVLTRGLPGEGHPGPRGGDARRVALYAAIGSEVATAELDALLRARGVVVAYPRCDASRRLSFASAAPHELVPGRFGVPEPRAEPLPLDCLDAVVLPGLAFDRRGGRLGYGAGCYDATLADYRGRRIGLCFSTQLVDDLPQEPHDQPVDLVITELDVAGPARAAQGEPCPS